MLKQSETSKMWFLRCWICQSFLGPFMSSHGSRKVEAFWCHAYLIRQLFLLGDGVCTCDGWQLLPWFYRRDDGKGHWARSGSSQETWSSHADAWTGGADLWDVHGKVWEGFRLNDPCQVGWGCLSNTFGRWKLAQGLQGLDVHHRDCRWELCYCAQEHWESAFEDQQGHFLRSLKPMSMQLENSLRWAAGVQILEWFCQKIQRPPLKMCLKFCAPVATSERHWFNAALLPRMEARPGCF